MKSKLLILATLTLVSTPAFALTCQEKVEMAVMGNLPSQEEYDVNAELETRKLENDGDTQLWHTTIDSGIDGGGKSIVYVVTSGEGMGACVLKGIFGL